MRRRKLVIISIILLACIVIASALLLEMKGRIDLIKGTVTKIELLKDVGFGKQVYVPVKSFEDKKTISEIIHILNNSEKIPGIASVTVPEYELKLTCKEKEYSGQIVDLWLGGDENGMCMLSSDTYKAYSITKENRLRLREILF